MKIRTDFVTNSSSSSFVAYQVESKEMTAYIKSLLYAGKAGKPYHGRYNNNYSCSYLTLDEDDSFSLIVQSSEIRGPWANFCKYDQGEDSIYNSSTSQRTSDSEDYNELGCLSQAIVSFFEGDATKEEIGKKLKECDLQVSCGTSMGETDGEGGDDCSFFSHKSYFGGLSKDARSYQIPEGVTEIPHNAFYGCSSLTSIMIPKSVTKIEERAFDGCSALTSITIPERVRKIEGDVFRDCSSLTSITIPENVTKIGKEAFRYCSSLTDITILNKDLKIKANTFYKSKRKGFMQTIHGYPDSTAQKYAEKYSLTFVPIVD